MNRLEIILSAIATGSVLINIFLFVYLRSRVIRLLSISEEMGDLQTMVNTFASHLKAVYELEAFYGDETLNNLLQHAISLNEQLDTFEYIYYLTEDESETQNILIEDELSDEEENKEI